MATPPGQIRDESGIFRKDIKILHVKVMPNCTDQEYELVTQSLDEAKKQLGDQYVVIVTRHIEMNIESMEDFIKRLEKEANAFKTPAIIDNLITSLKTIRNKRWSDEERAKEQARTSQYTPNTGFG